MGDYNAVLNHRLDRSQESTTPGLQKTFQKLKHSYELVDVWWEKIKESEIIHFFTQTPYLFKKSYDFSISTDNSGSSWPSDWCATIIGPCPSICCVKNWG